MKCLFYVFSFFLAITGALTQCDSNQCVDKMDATSIQILSTMSSPDDIQPADLSFIHAQLLKELLLTMKFDEQTSRKEFVNFFKETAELNEHEEMLELTRYEREFNRHSAIWWYTSPGFIHRTLNEALRLQDVLNLLRMGFLIQRIHRQLEHISQNVDEIAATFTVYRGQGLTYDDYGKLKKTAHGEFLAFNTFLSVNTNYDEAVNSARRAIRDGFETAVLFSIMIEPFNSGSIPFASVSDLSYFENSEGEYMFSINTVFRIEQLEKLSGKSGILHVKLRPISTRDKRLRQLMQVVRNDIERSTMMFQLAELMLIMEQYSTAETIYKRIINETLEMDIVNIEFIHVQLARIREFMNDSVGALECYERTMEIANSHRPINDSVCQIILVKIATLLHILKKFDVALEKFRQALALELQASVPDYPQRAILYNDIGIVLSDQGKHNETLEYHEQSLAINLDHAPNDHVNLAINYNNIGTTYTNMENYEMALIYYQMAIVHREQIIPMQIISISYDHLSIVKTLKKLDRKDEAAQHVKDAARLILPAYLDSDLDDQLVLDRLEAFLNSND